MRVTLCSPLFFQKTEKVESFILDMETVDKQCSRKHSNVYDNNQLNKNAKYELSIKSILFSITLKVFLTMEVFLENSVIKHRSSTPALLPLFLYLYNKTKFYTVLLVSLI